MEQEGQVFLAESGRVWRKKLLKGRTGASERDVGAQEAFLPYFIKKKHQVRTNEVNPSPCFNELQYEARAYDNRSKIPQS
jgi:hypothetical protein